MKRQKQTRKMKEKSGQQPPKQSKFAAKEARNLGFAGKAAQQVTSRPPAPQGIVATRPHANSGGPQNKAKPHVTHFRR